MHAVTDSFLQLIAENQGFFSTLIDFKKKKKTAPTQFMHVKIGYIVAIKFNT